MSALSIIARTDLSCLRIGGRDRQDFLNRLCSQKIVSNQNGDVLPAAFLNANGTVVALFHLWFRQTDIILICKKSLEDRILKFINDFHFGEDLICEKWAEPKIAELRQNQFAFGALKSAQIINGYTILPLESWKVISNQDEIRRAYAVLESVSGDIAKTFGGEILTSSQDYEQRVRAGVPSFPEEIKESNIILEGPFESYVHRNKGCYPGQEVVERIYTYGNVAKKIISFELKGKIGSFQTLTNGEIQAEGVAVGTILSIAKTREGAIGFASIKRLPLEKKQRLEALDSTGSYVIFSLST